MIKELIIQNWENILVLLAFAILLRTTVFLDKRTILRMYALILALFIFSMIVFLEFSLENLDEMPKLRLVLMAIRYSTTPFIIAFIIYTLGKYVHWGVFVPAIILVILDIISIFTGIVFSLNSEGELERGPLGYLPYIMVGVYSALFVYLLLKRSNKRPEEIFPVAFLCFAFASGLILPFVLGKDYQKIFCVTITIALFVYYVFLILQLTEKDALTGLLNKGAYIEKEKTGIYENKLNIRLIPVNTVSGETVLPAVKTEQMIINKTGKTKQGVLLAQSKTKISNGEYQLILNWEIMN